jgi:hypothetical protein
VLTVPGYILYIYTVLFFAMILPPFDPPSFEELSRYWRSCNYDDVHRVILEVLHDRLLATELAGKARSAEIEIHKVAPEDSAPSKAIRRLVRTIEREQLRSGPIGSSRGRIAEFSDEWRAREATRCQLYAHPDPADGEEPAALPRFQRVSWLEMRQRWRESDYVKGRHFSLDQRIILEVALARRVFRHLEKIARRAKGELMVENAAAAAMEELLRAIRSEIDEHAW